MPDREVHTIKELIFYQYAKIIGKMAFGPESKTEAYGFIKKKFRELRDDEMKWSDILREDRQLVEAVPVCAYCGSSDRLQWEHIVPKSLCINERCATCDHIQGIHNQIWACPSCNASKGTKGLYHFMKDLHPNVKHLSDCVPVLLEKKYLKTIYYCHQCNGTLDWDKGGEKLTVLDLDFPCLGR